MGDLSKHFSRWEWECKCNYHNCWTPDVSGILVKELELIRLYSGGSLTITSGSRCTKHNRDVGGVKRSQHRLSTAADIVSSVLTPPMLQDLLERMYPDQYGIGRYRTFTHFDIKPGKRRRWGLR